MIPLHGSDCASGKKARIGKGGSASPGMGVVNVWEVDGEGDGKMVKLCDNGAAVLWTEGGYQSRAEDYLTSVWDGGDRYGSGLPNNVPIGPGVASV